MTEFNSAIAQGQSLRIQSHCSGWFPRPLEPPRYAPAQNYTAFILHLVVRNPLTLAILRCAPIVRQFERVLWLF